MAPFSRILKVFPKFIIKIRKNFGNAFKILVSVPFCTLVSIVDISLHFQNFYAIQRPSPPPTQTHCLYNEIFWRSKNFVKEEPKLEQGLK